MAEGLRETVDEGDFYVVLGHSSSEEKCDDGKIFHFYFYLLFYAFFPLIYARKEEAIWVVTLML